MIRTPVFVIIGEQRAYFPEEQKQSTSMTLEHPVFAMAVSRQSSTAIISKFWNYRHY